MFMIKTKPVEEISPFIGAKTAAICCEGCSELLYPSNDVKNVLGELTVSGTDIAVIPLHYACNPEILELCMQKHDEEVNGADSILVFSCGVGVQTAAEMLHGRRVIAACDTYPLPGHQGLTPSDYDCIQCGRCHLNETAGICPVTSCSKSLTNGQCGGAKDGMCEVDPALECAWERINERLEHRWI